MDDVYTKCVNLFEKALEDSNLGEDEKHEIAWFYSEYLSENCSSINIVRNTEQGLKEKGLLVGTHMRRFKISADPNINSYIDTENALGKREKPENGLLDGGLSKRAKTNA